MTLHITQICKDPDKKFVHSILTGYLHRMFEDYSLKLIIILKNDRFELTAIHPEYFSEGIRFEGLYSAEDILVIADQMLEKLQE